MLRLCPGLDIFCAFVGAQLKSSRFLAGELSGFAKVGLLDAERFVLDPIDFPDIPLSNIFPYGVKELIVCL